LSHARPRPASLEALLVEEKLVEAAALRDARRVALRRRVPLLDVLVDEHAVDDGAVADAIARRLGVERVSLGAIDEEALREVAHDVATAHHVIPTALDSEGAQRTLKLAMANPLDTFALEDVAQSSGCRVEPVVASLRELRAALARSYRGMVTKMIPRFGTPSGEDPTHGPATQPHLQLPDESSVDARLRALVDLLVERGVLAATDREALDERVRRLIRGEDV
jgi:hypothetical protein